MPKNVTEVVPRGECPPAIDTRDPRNKGGWFDPSKGCAPREPKRHANCDGDASTHTGGMRPQKHA